MDDTIKSVETEGECVELVSQLVPLIAGMDMKIQKFYSNSTKALSGLPKDCLSTKVHFEQKDAVLEANKVLGMIWEAQSDSFKYACKFKTVSEFYERLNLPPNPKWTKRLILKLSATVYDPLGLISPITVRSRLILQDLWKEELEWDMPIPESYGDRWNDWLTDLFELPKICNVPRHLQFQSDRLVELHVFADASTKVFATCVYTRVLKRPKTTSSTTIRTRKASREEELLKTGKIDVSEIVDISLVASKAKVTPSKTESVSRLELAACVIATRLGNAVAQCYGIDPDTIKYWTDSKNCLFWINTPSSTLKTFVSNRVGEIQTNSRVENWRHVPTEINPADIPTRTPKVDELASNTLWWKGPNFLQQAEENWPPKFVPPVGDEDAKNEFKKIYLNFGVLESQHKLDARAYSVGKLWDGFERLIRNTSCLFSHIFVNKTQIEITTVALEFQIRRAQREVDETGEVFEQIP